MGNAFSIPYIVCDLNTDNFSSKQKKAYRPGIENLSKSEKDFPEIFIQLEDAEIFGFKKALYYDFFVRKLNEIIDISTNVDKIAWNTWGSSRTDGMKTFYILNRKTGSLSFKHDEKNIIGNCKKVDSLEFEESLKKTINFYSREMKI